MGRFPSARKREEERGIRCRACGSVWRHWMAIDLMQVANRCLRCSRHELELVTVEELTARRR